MGDSPDSGSGNESNNESNNEPQGTVFGVDGRSKTGSTAQDAAIGFTDGSGGKGQNFAALDNATSEQTSTAVAAANAAAAAGGNQQTQNDAVAAALSNYSTGSVSRAGNLTDKGKSAVQSAVESALSQQAERDAMAETYGAAAPVAAAFGMPAGATPMDAAASAKLDSDLNAFISGADIFSGPQPTPEVNLTVNRRPDIPENAQNMSNLILSRRVGSPAAFGVDTNIAMTALQDRALQGDPQAQDLLDEAAARGDITQAQADYARGFTTQGSAPAAPVGVAAAPEATAEAVLRGPDQVIAEQRAAGITSLAPSTTAQGMPIGKSMGGANELFGGTPTTGLATDFSPEMMTPSGISGVNNMPMAPVETNGQFTIGGVPVTEDLANTASQMRGDIFGALPSPTPGIIDKGIGFLTGQDPVESAATTYGQMLSIPGSVIDPETGNITAPAGGGTLNLNNQGMLAGSVTYSGMPDPNYSGPFSNLVNPSQTSDGSDPSPMTTDITQPEIDPCPPGFQMVNGTCQPIQQPAAPGSNFVVNPTTGLPTAFTPFTQATQVGAINPFVLQPYAPGQNPFGQPVAQGGIQAMSPTATALGRQV